eukprot:1397059-Rhodomonas_salina.4
MSWSPITYPPMPPIPYALCHCYRLPMPPIPYVLCDRYARAGTDGAYCATVRPGRAATPRLSPPIA